MSVFRTINVSDGLKSVFNRLAPSGENKFIMKFQLGFLIVFGVYTDYAQFSTLNLIYNFFVENVEKYRKRINK